MALIGDSIFDNAPYVQPHKALHDHLHALLPEGDIHFLAVDGSVTLEVLTQLQAVSSDLIFISTGGNDALGLIPYFESKVSTVSEAFNLLGEKLQQFAEIYDRLIAQASQQCQQVICCTIYNQVPGLSLAQYTALRLFNEQITLSANRYKSQLIDLRLLCDQVEDYSSVSPIEPSEQGGYKIAQRIAAIAQQYDSVSVS